MSKWIPKPLYKHPKIRTAYIRRAERCAILDNQRIYCYKIRDMDEYKDISDRLEYLWQSNIDIYDLAHEKYKKD